MAFPEGSPISPTHEAQTDSFGIRNFYSPESLYALFTRDYKAYSVGLQNNWGEVREAQYDPISSIRVYAACDLKHLYDNNVRNRNEKVIHMYGSVATKDWEKLANEINGVSKAGNLSDFTKSKEDVRKEFATRFLNEFKILSLNFEHVTIDPKGIVFSNQNSTPPIRLEIGNGFFGVAGNHLRGTFSFGSSSNETNTLRLTLPFPRSSISLSSVEDVEKLLGCFFTHMEKIIRAIYRVQGKDLPPAKLQFKTVKEQSPEFYASCGYCDRKYFAAQDPVCPGCGASKPVFITK